MRINLMIDAQYEPTFFRLAADVKEALRVQARRERRTMVSLSEEILRTGLAARTSPPTRAARAADPDAVAKLIAAAGE
jgi:plasmid stability protein